MKIYRSFSQLILPFSLGLLLSPLSNAESISELTSKANQGNLAAQLELAKLYKDGSADTPKDHKKAIYWYQKADENGSKDAAFYLGWIYENPEGMQPDYQKAISWYKKEGSPAALNNLGVMYATGRGIEKNEKLAFETYKEAAEGGDKVAMENLANMYADGEGIAQDYKQAVYWLQKFAEQEQEK